MSLHINISLSVSAQHIVQLARRGHISTHQYRLSGARQLLLARTLLCTHNILAPDRGGWNNTQICQMFRAGVLNNNDSSPFGWPSVISSQS